MSDRLSKNRAKMSQRLIVWENNTRRKSGLGHENEYIRKRKRGRQSSDCSIKPEGIGVGGGGGGGWVGVWCQMKLTVVGNWDICIRTP